MVLATLLYLLPRWQRFSNKNLIIPHVFHLTSEATVVIIVMMKTSSAKKF